MTLRSFFGYTFLQWLFLTLLKIAFFNYIFFGNAGLQKILFWVITMVLAAAFVRRMGVINYLEAIFIAITWTLLDMFFDLIITSLYVKGGVGIFAQTSLWIGYFILALTVFLVHKKRHIAIRKGEYEEPAHH